MPRPAPRRPCSATHLSAMVEDQQKQIDALMIKLEGQSETSAAQVGPACQPPRAAPALRACPPGLLGLPPSAAAGPPILPAD